MSLETEARLPVIDFSSQELKPGSPEWDSVKAQVREALEEHGYFEASFDRVAELRTPVFGALEELFDLPLQRKKLCVLRSHFVAIMGLQHDCMRAWRLMNIWPETLNNFTNVLWPQGHRVHKVESALVGGDTTCKTHRPLVVDGLLDERYFEDFFQKS
ncbi:probable 2-oxoglutarate-dependent dioxygenase AOP1 [Hibiscus syriacus]|uniref:probable 2-oxoglutarate-dependent dioxygenase AOP1 n=1 Tax=Hibiscus syriacus TaxID=106335 RepID=UPI001923A705|nr:probable 2-oxoglutarate-dependent dioxygenase AOP1 [Hibiscus syriacus]